VSNERPWYRKPEIIVPAILIILAPIISGIVVLILSPQLPTTPMFKEIGGDTDADGDYEISWESSERAISYILQEDSNPSFTTNPRTVYKGSETQANIYGKSNGDYYYQAKACNKAGESEWSPIRKITVMLSPPLTPTPTPVVTPIPTPTATPPCIIDTMDNTSGWKKYIENGTESSINFTSVPGRIGNATAISYDMKEGGYVSIIKEITPEILSGKEGIKFYYKGSGKPNTLALILVYGDPEYTSFGVVWYSATVRDDWISFEGFFEGSESDTNFRCLWPLENCDHYGGKLDLNYVRAISFAIRNNYEAGDIPGSGMVLIDDVQGICPNK